MPTYESMLVCQPNLPDEKINEVVDKLKRFISQNNGRIVIAEKWGKRRLAYKVKRFEEGYYLRIVFESDQSLISEFEGFCRVDENIIRRIIIRSPEEKAVRSEQKKNERR